MTCDKLLARIAEYLPELDLGQHRTEWRVHPDDGSPVLWVDGGEMMFSAHGEDLHVAGPLEGFELVGCVVVKPDGSRYLAATERDPFASAAQAASDN